MVLSRVSCVRVGTNNNKTNTQVRVVQRRPADHGRTVPAAHDRRHGRRAALDPGVDAARRETRENSDRNPRENILEYEPEE